jgi:hypothetical protein
MSFIDSLERKFLFILTRFLALLIISCLLIAIVVGGIMFSEKLFPKDDTKVTPTEVMDAIKPPVPTYNNPQSQPEQQQTVPDINVLPGIKIPFILQKYFNNPDSIKLLKGWMENIPKGKGNEFINELAAVVEEAEKTNANVTNAINQYKELKFSKIKDSQIAKTETNMIRLQYFGLAFACVALIALFSLVLVLLAIERNTRKGAI